VTQFAAALLATVMLKHGHASQCVQAIRNPDDVGKWHSVRELVSRAEVRYGAVREASAIGNSAVY